MQRWRPCRGRRRDSRRGTTRWHSYLVTDAAPRRESRQLTLGRDMAPALCALRRHDRRAVPCCRQGAGCRCRPSATGVSVPAGTAVDAIPVVSAFVLCYPVRMTPKLSDEQRQAIQNREGGPVEVEDDRTQRVYVLVARDEFHRLVEEQLRRELQVGFNQADAGDVAAWDLDEMLQAARQRHAFDAAA